MKNNNEENNFIKISPIHLPLKNNSLQTSISKDYSNNNFTNEDIINLNPVNLHQTIRNFAKYVHIINFQNEQLKNQFSTIPIKKKDKDDPKDTDRGKFTNTIIKGKFNFNPISDNKI